MLAWNWIFFINIPIGIPILLLVIRTFPPIRTEVQNRSLDYLGMVTLVLSVVPVLLALSIVGVHYAWDTPQVIGCLAFGLVMTAIFAIVESKAVAPIMPFEIYRFSVVAVATAVASLAGFGLYGTIVFLPFSARVEETVSDAVRAALGPGRLDAIKDNPRVLIDPAALDVLRAEFAETGTEGVQMADALLGTLHSALAEAVGDMFAISVVVIALSVVLSLFMRVAKEDSQGRNSRTLESAEEVRSNE